MGAVSVGAVSDWGGEAAGVASDWVSGASSVWADSTVGGVFVTVSFTTLCSGAELGKSAHGAGY